jgi:hypothetical protein
MQALFSHLKSMHDDDEPLVGGKAQSNIIKKFKLYNLLNP